MSEAVETPENILQCMSDAAETLENILRSTTTMKRSDMGNSISPRV